MSAAELFKDCHDVEFRLRGTFIMIGREPYRVNATAPNVTAEAKDALLYLQDSKGNEKVVALGRLPLRSMIDCPSGYFDGYWYARGPARSRHQGITSSSLWAVMFDGRVMPDGVSNPFSVLQTLCQQPRIRRPGKRPQGAITRDVLVGNNGRVLVRGILRGEYLGENTFKPITEISPVTAQLIANAKLFTKDEPQLEIPLDMCAGRPEQ